jgi:hypothetical protein
VDVPIALADKASGGILLSHLIAILALTYYLGGNLSQLK